MSTTITAASGAGTVTADMLLGYQTSRSSRNIVYDVIGGGIAIVLVAPRPRSGQLGLLFVSKSNALAALSLLGNETTFTLTDTDLAEAGMTFALDGEASLALDEQTRRNWVLTVGYQELS